MFFHKLFNKNKKLPDNETKKQFSEILITQPNKRIDTIAEVNHKYTSLYFSSYNLTCYLFNNKVNVDSIRDILLSSIYDNRMAILRLISNDNDENRTNFTFKAIYPKYISTTSNNSIYINNPYYISYYYSICTLFFDVFFETINKRCNRNNETNAFDLLMIDLVNDDKIKNIESNIKYIVNNSINDANIFMDILNNNVTITTYELFTNLIE